MHALGGIFPRKFSIYKFNSAVQSCNTDLGIHSWMGGTSGTGVIWQPMCYLGLGHGQCPASQLLFFTFKIL